MADCDDRQLTEAQRVAGYQNGRTGVLQAVRPFTGRPTIENVIDYINRELQPAVKRTRDKVNDIYLPVTDNAPSGNPLGFYFSTNTANADPTAGRIRLNASPQDSATVMRVSQSSGRLVDVAPWLDVMSGGATTPLGVVTLTDAINPARFVRFDLSSMVDQGAYWDLTVAVIESSHDDPFVDGGAVVVSFIPGVGGATPATVPPTSMGAIAANTVLGNATALSASPTAIAVAASTVVGRTSTGNIAALTGAQVATILRYGVIVDTASTGTVVSYAPTGFSSDTVGIRISPASNLILRGMALVDGQQIAIRVGRGAAGAVTLNHEDGSATSAAERFNCPGNVALTLRAGEGCIIRYTESRGNVIAAGRTNARLGAPVYDVVLDFGAAGNGSTDDTAALNAAIAAANAAPGDIYLGLAHLVTAALDPITSNNIMIRGRGPFDRGSRIDCNAVSAPTHLLTFAGQYTGIADTYIRAVPDTYATGNAIHISATYRALVERCRIQNFANGIEVDESTLSVIDDCELYNIREGYGIWVHGSTSNYSHATWISHIVCDEGIGSEVTWFLHDSHAHTMRLIDCAALNGGYGLRVVDTISPGVNPPHFTRAVNLELDHQKFGGIVLEGGEQAEFEQLFVTGMIGGNAAVAVEIKSTYSGDWRFDGGFIFAARAEGFKIAKGDGILSGVIISACSLDSGNTYDAISIAAGVQDFTIVGCSTAPTYRSPGLTSRYDLSIGAGCDNYVVTGNRFGGSITGTIVNTPGVSSTRIVRSNIPDTATGIIPDGDYGDITVSSSGTVWNIDADTVGNTELANMAAARVKGRAIGAGTGDPTDLTQTQLSDLFRVVTSVDDTSATGTYNDFVVAEGTKLLRINPTGSGDFTITGIILGSSNTGGWIRLFKQSGGGTDRVVLKHESSSSTSTNRFQLPDGADFVLDRANDAVDLQYIGGRWQPVARSTAVRDADYGDITVSSSGTVWNIDADVVTDAKIRDSAALSVIGRSTNSSGDPADIAIPVTTGGRFLRTNTTGFPSTNPTAPSVIGWGVITLLDLPILLNNRFLANVSGGDASPVGVDFYFVADGSRGLEYDPTDQVYFVKTNVTMFVHTDGTVQREAISGDVVIAQFSNTATIATAAVTLAKQADLAQSRIIGRAEGAGTGVPTALTPAQVVAIIDGEAVTWTGSHTFNGTNFTVTAGADVALTASGGTMTLAATTQVQITSPTRLASSLTFDSVGSTAATAANNLAINSVNVVRFTGGMDPLTGMIPVVDGQVVLLVNAHASTNMGIHMESGSSSAANRFSGIGTSRVIRPGEMGLAWYDGADDRWRLLLRDEVDL